MSDLETSDFYSFSQMLCFMNVISLYESVATLGALGEHRKLKWLYGGSLKSPFICQKYYIKADMFSEPYNLSGNISKP